MKARRPPSKKPRSPRAAGPSSARELGYVRNFISPAEREAIVAWLGTLRPIWERRFSTERPLPAGEEQRWLLRPVYWLGNWQFACLDYYHPPKGVLNRCVQAEGYPPAMAGVVARIEEAIRRRFKPSELPPRWRFNTCLINFYGARLENGKRVDVARVGEHRDYEPGPVASLSLGDRALFQFVESRRRGTREGVVLQQWLEDRSLQLFGGPYWKDRLFHRVQRVERKSARPFPVQVDDFEVRRVNFTFRHVPEEHIIPYKDLPPDAAADVREYMERLARHSQFFAAAVRSRHGHP